MESGSNYHGLDDHLMLPGTQMSYKLQEWIGKGSTETNYRSSVSQLNDILGLTIEGSEVKRIVEGLSPLVDAYYEDNPVQRDEGDAKVEVLEEGTHLCFGNDGKGVPVIQSERTNKVKDVGRLMKGQKRGTKKQATVAVSFSFNPFVRTSEDILQSLFNDGPVVVDKKGKKGVDKSAESPKSDNRMSIGMHRRAFMGEQKKAIHYAIDRLMVRPNAAQKDIIALVDCGTGLETGILQAIEEKGLSTHLKAIIADVVHVSEYVWKAANAVLGEKSEQRTPWVRSKLKDILEGKVKNVIIDFQTIHRQQELKETQALQLDTTIKYLQNHQHKMQYDVYLKNGYPISTGIIESTCGHLVKDRMEDSGMRWSIQGAQQMLDIRAVNKNGDWKHFLNYCKSAYNPNKLKIAA